MSSRLPAAFAPASLPARLSPAWLMARLRSMSAAEMRTRAARTALRAWRRMATDGSAGAATDTLTGTVWLCWNDALSDADRHALAGEAEDLLAGRYRLLGRCVRAGSPPDWHRPFGAAPSAPEASTLPLHPAEELRYALELHRHGAVAILAQAALLLDDDRYALRALDLLTNWIRCNPVGQGPGWGAAIEPAMRLIQWSVAWQALARRAVLRPALSRALADRAPAWSRSIVAHAQFVRSEQSSHSSANNHLLAELAGLAAAAWTWPPLQLGVADTLTHEFAREFVAQHYADGVNREQAIDYQVFVLQLGLLVRLAAQGVALPPQFDDALAASARFLDAARDVAGNLARWGDGDDADAIAWRPAPQDRVSAVIRQVQRARADDATAATRSSGAPRAFAQGGHYLLGRDFGGAREVRAAIDCGPLGYLGIAAHGHADALSILLSVAGTPVLVDRGTFVYNARPAWRRRLRGTLSHNTVSLDGADQSEPAGPFLWLRKARASCEYFFSSDAYGRLVGCHDGFLSLPHPALHRRTVDWDGYGFTVTDRIEALGENEIVVAWHLAPGLPASARGAGFDIELPTCVVRIASDLLTDSGRHTDFRWLRLDGDPASLLGWHSSRFGELEPATSLFYSGRSTGNVAVRTTIDILWKEPRR